jgi:hypothetical protein
MQLRLSISPLTCVNLHKSPGIYYQLRPLSIGLYHLDMHQSG